VSTPIASRAVRAQRGDELRCRGWRQETILRLLENNLELGEIPDDLVIYGSSKAARDWDAYAGIVAALKTLGEDETLVVQSGKAVGTFPSSPDAPLVIMANGNTIGATPDEIEQLADDGLSVRPGMTAAAWQYIGSQGIIQGTYETFMAAAHANFGGSLTGRRILTAGCGGMGGAQPLAGVLAGASILVAEVQPKHLGRRLREGYLGGIVDDIGAAIDKWTAHAERGEAASVGVAANAVDVLREVKRRGIVPDIATDQTATEPMHGYIPVGLSAEERDRMATEDPERLSRLAGETVAEHVQLLLDLQRQGTVVFDYGNDIRERAHAHGITDAFDIRGFIDLYIRPYFCDGVGPFRLIAMRGNPETILRIDRLLLELFEDVPRVTDWLAKAPRIPFTGLPARICWLGHGERTRAALAINDLIATGEIAGPVAFTRDHLDSGSVTAPRRETENMRDGSDKVADWPILNGLLSTAMGADLVSVHSIVHHSMNAGPTVIADGTPAAAARLTRVMDADTTLGVLRHADAGYERAQHVAEHHRLGVGKHQTANRNGAAS
jgi:urocanate hydratase